MKVFLAGATGVIGAPLVPRLLAAGHDVTGTTRVAGRAQDLRAAGVEPVVLDAFDADAVRAAVLAARPEVVILQLTALPRRINPRRYAEAMEPTSRLREETTPVFVAAAREAGARRVVVQSISFVTGPDGPPVHDETAPLYLDGPGAIGAPIRATAAMERCVTGADGLDGVVLRYGFLYGPGTVFAPDGSSVEEIRKRRYPVVGSGEGRFSFVHVEDAAAATVLALDTGAAGIYNITDDDPAPMRDWLPEAARIIGAPKPRRVPAWVARLAVGPHAVHWGTTLRGNANAKARRDLGFVPAYPTWREGFTQALVER